MARAQIRAPQHPRQMVFNFAYSLEFSTASLSTTGPWSVGDFDAAAVLSDPVVLDAADFPAAIGGAALS